jgi:hypothetical protein
MRLQRIPFDRSGTPPGVGQSTEPRPGDDCERLVALDLVAAYFGPPRRMQKPPSTAWAG